MAKKISSKELFEGSLFGEQIEEAKALLKVVQEVQGEFKQYGKTVKTQLLKLNKESSEGIAELNKLTKDLEKNTKSFNKTKDEEAKIEARVIKLMQEEEKVRQQELKTLAEEEKAKQAALRTSALEEKAIITERKEQERLEKERQKQIRSIKAEDDAYKKLAKERTKAQNEYKKLAVELGESSKEAQEALSAFNELDEKFTSINKAVKDGRPFVGRYADAIKEAGIDGQDTSKIISNLEKEQEELTKTLEKQRREFGKSSKEVKENEERLKSLNETIEEIAKSSKNTEKAIDKLTGAVKTLVAASILLQAFEFVADIFKTSDEGADDLSKTLGRLVVSVQVLVSRVGTSFEALKNLFAKTINEVKLSYFEFLDSLNTRPLVIAGVQVFSGQVANVTDKIIELKKEQEILAKSNTDVAGSFDGLTEEINKKIEANDKAIDQERTNIKQIALLELQSAKLARTVEKLSLLYDNDSQSLTDRKTAITEAITIQEELNKTTLSAVKLEVEAARLRAKASTDNAQAQADFINAQARAIEVETQGLTELNSLRIENNSINRDIRDLELDVLLDNVDNIKTINERKIADESLAQKERKALLNENVKIIEDSFKLQGDVVNKELTDLGKRTVDFNDLLQLSSEELAKYLTDNTGETQAIRILEILKERRLALQDLTETQKELNETDKEIVATNEDIILQEQALIDLQKEGADSNEILSKLEKDREALKIKNLKEEIELLKEKNALEGGDSLELLQKQNELNDLLLKGQEELNKKDEEATKKAEENKIKAKESTLKLLKNLSDEYYEGERKRINENISASQREEDRLIEAAEKGVQLSDESIAFERKQQAELAAEKEEAAQKQARAELLLASLSSLNANDGDLGKTVTDIVALREFVKSFPLFLDGTENTGAGGNLDGDGGFAAILHPNEKVLKSEHTDRIRKSLGNVSNEELVAVTERYASDSLGKREDLAFMQNIDYSEKFESLQKEIRELPKRMPQNKLDWDPIRKVVVESIKKEGSVTRYIHKTNRLL